MEMFERSAYMPELSKGPRKLQNRVDLMTWSAHVKTRDKQGSKPVKSSTKSLDDKNILSYLVIPLNFPG